MSEKRILLVNRSIYLPGEGGYKRTMFLFDFLRRRGCSTTLLTGDFNHYAKKRRDTEAFRKDYPEYPDIHFIHVPAYRKNISPGRLNAEKVWARGAAAWFREHSSEFDLVYMIAPDFDTILSFQKIRRGTDIKMIVDVRDLWPEAFRVAVKNDRAYRALFSGMKKKADRAYACADELIAVSREYLDRALETNKNSKDPKVVYLGATLSRFDGGAAKYAGDFTKEDGEFRFVYAGTLGDSYDLDTVIRAAAEVKERGGLRVTVKILGQGPDLRRLEALAASAGADNVEFCGFMEYGKMAAFLRSSDCAINSLKKNAAQSIINKIADYFAAGIPTLNGSMKPEMRRMIDDNGVGLNYEAEDAASLVSAMKSIIDLGQEAARMGKNARALAERDFDRENSYVRIAETIDSLLR